MDSLQQLWPLVRPHRHALAAAICCAVLAAGLWAVALLLAFPMTKVLLEQSSLQEYVAREIETAQTTAATAATRLQELNAGRQTTAGSVDATAQRRAETSLRRLETDLREAEQRVWRLTLFQQHLLPYLPTDRFDTLALLLCGLLVVTACHGGAVYLQEVWIGRVVQLSLRSLRARLFRQTLQLDTQTVMAEGTPVLLSRFTNDLTAIAQGMTLLGGKIVLEPLKAGACIASALLINWRLTLLSLLCAPIGGFLFQRFGKKLKKASRRQMETVARIYQVLQEALSAFRVVTAFGRQRHHRHLLYRENRDYYRKTMAILRLDALANPTVELLAVCAACLAILPGAYLVLRQKTAIWGVQLTETEMDLATLALLYSLLIGVLDPARKLSSAFSKLKKSVAACERVMTWMDQQQPASKPGGSSAPLRHQRELRFENVTFAYRSHEATTGHQALQQIDFTVEFGDVVAIVGGNGSGKSTLAGLIPGFYEPLSGRILIDEVNLADMPLRTLRQQIGWVPQDPMLFDRTIAGNIAAGDQQLSRAEIEAAARQAHVTDFTHAWEEGLETHVGASGQRLSGGQRQRIALARALVRNPSILILDEATSAIDAQSEALIYSALQDGCDRRTTLVITHTLTPALLSLINKVLFLDRGRLLATGTHEQLLDTCPPYAALYEAQAARRAA